VFLKNNNRNVQDPVCDKTYNGILLKRANKNKRLYLPLFENKLNPKNITMKLKVGIEKTFDISSFLPIRKNEDMEEFDEETIELSSDGEYLIVNQNIKDSHFSLKKEGGMSDLSSFTNLDKIGLKGKEDRNEKEEDSEELQTISEKEEIDNIEIFSTPKQPLLHEHHELPNDYGVVKKMIDSKYLGKIEILEIEFPVKLKFKEKFVKAVHEIETKIGDAVHNIESKIEQVVNNIKKKHVKNLNVEERLNAVKGYLVPFPKKFLLNFNFSSWKKNLPSSIFI
jgi:hypothetical protein